MNNIITNANGVKVKVRVYDFGDKTADRYTIVCVSGKSNNHNNVMYYPIFSCSSNPIPSSRNSDVCRGLLPVEEKDIRFR